MIVEFKIPGQPCAKQRPRLGKGFTYTPVKTVNYETLVKQIYSAERLPYLEGELIMMVRAFFQIPKSVSKKDREAMQNYRIRPVKKPDWDNIGKIISDALNGIAYHDDSQIVSATVTKWYDDIPRVEVYLEVI